MTKFALKLLPKISNLINKQKHLGYVCLKSPNWVSIVHECTYRDIWVWMRNSNIFLAQKCPDRRAVYCTKMQDY